MGQRNLPGDAARALLCILFLLGANAAFAVQPEVKTVPWVPGNPLIPHDAISGELTTLKGTSSIDNTNVGASGPVEYTWDFGDGSPVATGAVTDRYAIEATHTYTGTDGTVFTATLTVEDTATGESDSENYFVVLQPKTLEIEVNIAIDEGLWYLHKNMQNRSATPPLIGEWRTGFAGSIWFSNTASNLQAFEVNGHLPTGAGSNPYTETATRALNRVFQFLTPRGIGNQTNGYGTFSPDTNGNGIGLGLGQSREQYQGGMLMDAIIAAGTPGAIAATGVANVVGRTHSDIIHDMADYYAYCQYDPAGRGGWRYVCNQFPDGSANQWAAIGMIPAERSFGYPTPPQVKSANVDWVNFARNANGSSGYTNANSIWGPYATTPSGTVQMVWNGIGRGNPTWDGSETFLRDNFCNQSTSTSVRTRAQQGIRDYYYGLFSFTKSMLLHDPDGDGTADPIQFLQSATAGVDPIDWYSAEAANGDDCDGVARTLVDDQHPSGYWSAHNFTSEQYHYETGWAIIMLNRTVFASGVPVAVASANPNPAVAGQTIALDGSGSFHQDPSRTIISWAWDLDDDGLYDDASGVSASTSFPAVGDYPVGLEVCDDGAEQACDTTTLIIRVDTPPIAPTADAAGPYNFCPQTQPWFLDGTGSSNPDEGGSEPGQPGDTIQSYAWELSGNNAFDDASGAQPDVTAFYDALGPGNYLAQLRVTDTTGTSYPSSSLGDLSDTDSAQVRILAADDPSCECIDDLAARPKDGKVSLTWTDSAPAGGYNVYRSTTSGGPYDQVANTTSSYSTWNDTDVVNGTTYYYVVRPAGLAGEELCESNEASATPAPRTRRR